MKKPAILIAISLLLASMMPLTAQNQSEGYLGLPGDNLNLYAVMNLFQESETLESFERGLNDPETMINNLDLNNNNMIDYIMVLDFAEGDLHNIVLRVALNEKESQDVAVFTVQKFSDGSVQIQLIGDEALYGQNYIIEPNYEETPNPGYTGAKATTTEVVSRTKIVRTTYYEVAAWPIIVYVSSPTYVVWRSSWGWNYYPAYWHPWTPYYYHYYYGYHSGWNHHYHAYYRPWGYYRCDRYRTSYYAHHRHYSPTVVVNINTGTYRNTYSRPEQRKEGETYYAHRVSRGESLPGSSKVSRDANNNPRIGSKNQPNNRAVGSPTDERKSRDAQSREAREYNRPQKDQAVNPDNVSRRKETKQNDKGRRNNPAEVKPARQARDMDANRKAEEGQSVRPAKTDDKPSKSSAVKKSDDRNKSSVKESPKPRNSVNTPEEARTRNAQQAGTARKDNRNTAVTAKKPKQADSRKPATQAGSEQAKKSNNASSPARK
jgi:hypothetical protein